MRDPRVFSIPTGIPFLPALAGALLDGTLTGGWPDGATLADATIFLPTRRAGRAFAAHLAARSERRAVLLPRIVPLGDLGEDSFEPVVAGPPPIPATERRLVLARLVQRWATTVENAPGRPRVASPDAAADAVALAADLADLMDSLATEGVDWDELAQVVDAEHSEYFATTLSFVRIAHENWPQILAERGASDPARRRHEALLVEAERLTREAPLTPIVAAGSTGSVAATAQLLSAIARLPHGGVVLPGLDTDLDEAAWRSVGGREAAIELDHGPLWTHPQCMMRRLLADPLRVERDAVRVLGPALPHAHPVAARRRLLSEVMRPAESTDIWAQSPIERKITAEAGCDGLALVSAADEREEALAIAVALRETLEGEGRTAALVTPDRALARRVAVELRRWGLDVEDTAGVALADTGAGRLARLAAEAAASEFQPLSLLALLAHPDVTLGLSRGEIEAAAATLEIGVLRGPAPASGLDGLLAALEVRRAGRSRLDPLPKQALSESDWDDAKDLLARLSRAFAEFLGRPAENGRPNGRHAEERPEGASRSMHHGRASFETAAEPVLGPAQGRTRGRLPQDDDVVAGRTERNLVALAASHADALIALTARADEDETQAPDRSWTEVLNLLDELALLGDDSAIRGGFGEYPAFFATLARERTLPPERGGGHPRVRILGLLEARLLDVDRVVLGALDEGIWPPTAESDAFLNRPMRLKLGLSPAERRIGQTAQDFVGALGTADAVLTHARKRDGKPTVPSRFLERLRAFVGPTNWKELSARGSRYRAFAAALERPEPGVPITRPAPRPGGARFPRSLSVTEVETLIRDPFSIFARHILRLSPLDPVGAMPSPAEKGTILHAVLSDFATAYPGELGRLAQGAFLQIGSDHFAGLEDGYPDLYALWWPEFQRIAPHVLAWEAGRRAAFAERFLERSGRLELPLGQGEVLTIRARADRIEVDGDGRAAIVDFKSGRVPSSKEVAVGFSPQLTLEAAMLSAGGFADMPAPSETPELHYVKLGGRARLVVKELGDAEGKTLAAQIDAHVEGLTRLARRFVCDDGGYTSRPHPRFASAFSPYDHLARVAEWSVGDEGGDAP